MALRGDRHLRSERGTADEGSNPVTARLLVAEAIEAIGLGVGPVRVEVAPRGAQLVLRWRVGEVPHSYEVSICDGDAAVLCAQVEARSMARSLAELVAQSARSSRVPTA